MAEEGRSIESNIFSRPSFCRTKHPAVVGLLGRRRLVERLLEVGLVPHHDLVAEALRQLGLDGGGLRLARPGGRGVTGAEPDGEQPGDEQDGECGGVLTAQVYDRHG